MIKSNSITLNIIWQISPDDIRWEGEDTGMPRRGGRPGTGRGAKKSSSRGGAVTGAGRGRGTPKGQPKKDSTLSQNGGRKKPTGDIEILHTDSLIKEVWTQTTIRGFSNSNYHVNMFYVLIKLNWSRLNMFLVPISPTSQKWREQRIC